MRPTLALACFLAFFAQLSGQTPLLFTDDFANSKHETRNSKLEMWQPLGPGGFEIADSKLKTQNSKLLIVGDENWTDYELKFRARAPENAEQVQIWASLRLQSRDDRYTFGFRGGNHDDVILARYGYLGTDEFLAIRPLDFHPEPGAWFEFRFLVFGDHLMLFVNPSTQLFNFSTAQPIIHVRDSSHLKSGKIALGGGWLPTEYDDVQVRRLEMEEIGRLKNLAEADPAETAAQKEARRATQRAAYQPLKIAAPDGPQAEFPLDGDWLFLPDYQLNPEAGAINPDSSDAHWHVLHVPDFWNENRVWLHGEDAMMRSGDKGVSDNYRQLDQKRCESYTFDYRKTNIGYYRQWLTVDGGRWAADGGRQAVDGESFITHHSSFIIQFSAVSKIAKVWVNGQFVGEHVGMFAPFEFDVSRFLKPGRNLLVVKVVKNYTNLADGDRVADLAESVGVTKKMLNDLPHGIYTHDPAGIWQPVKLLICNSLHIADVFIRPNLAGAAVDVYIKNDSPTKRTVSLDLEVVESPPSGGRGAVLFSQKNMATWTLAPGSSAEKTVEFGGLAPKLWSPEHPNLYELRLVLHAPQPPEGGVGGGKNSTDSSFIIHHSSLKFGFCTFERRGDFFYLNGKPRRMLGANHTPMSIRPNDAVLADTFLRKMHDGGLFFTRTTTAPFNETWLQAADRQGVAVSFEGAFPWLMMRGDIPDSNLLNLWREEFFDLVRNARNHPSVLLWTVNNEMKFYEKDTVRARVQAKFRIVSDVVKSLRQLDPTRPVVFDSGYRRDTVKFDRKFIAGIDDGDADDIHSYFNWYYFSIFDCFDSTFTRWYRNPGRPLISQEFSSGYPTNDAGHPTRFYTYPHYVPQALVGQWAYEDHEPRYFLERQAFIAKEGFEGLRRSTPALAGLQAFSSICWFRDVYDAARISPYPTYDAMRLAAQPVLVSAELWSRHFYAGDTLRARVCVVNDGSDGHDLPATKLRWSIDYQDVSLASGEQAVPQVAHFSRLWDSVAIRLPMPPQPSGGGGVSDLKQMKLRLELTDGRTVFSKNEYDLLVGERLGILPKNSAWRVVEADKFSRKQIRKLRRDIRRGAQVVVLHAGKQAMRLLPGIVDSVMEKPGEMVQIRVPESPVFEGIGPLDLCWWNSGKPGRPISCPRSYYVHPQRNVEILAQFTVTHGAINPAFHKRHERVREFTGFPLVDVRFGKGRAVLCELNLEFADRDPVAGLLLRNLLSQ